MKIRVKVRTNKVGSECINEFDAPDDMDRKELEELALDTALDMIDWEFEVIE